MNNIAKIRNENGISQIQLVRELGWTQPRIANYEAGTRMPSLNAARKIVSALNQLGANVEIDQVFPAEN